MGKQCAGSSSSLTSIGPRSTPDEHTDACRSRRSLNAFTIPAVVVASAHGFFAIWVIQLRIAAEVVHVQRSIS